MSVPARIHAIDVLGSDEVPAVAAGAEGAGAMSLVDEARRLEELGCDCEGVRHASDCPVLSLPRIVAVLEAAERWAESMILSSSEREVNVYTCGGCGASAYWEVRKIRHEHDCLGLALAGALRGEEARPG